MTNDDRDWNLQLRSQDRPLGVDSEAIRGPVSDFATDFDHTDDQWAHDPYPIWDDLRERCPVAHTNRYGGAWLPTKHDHVSEIAHDTDRFTSRSPVMTNHRPPLEMAPAGISPPISSDPPFHHDARRLLLPAFAPQAIAKLEERTRAYCNELLDATEGQHVIDAAADYAQHIPIRVISDMLGFPREDSALFAKFVHIVLESVNLPPEVRLARMDEFFNYLFAQIEDHRRNPRDDLTSFLLEAEMDGEKLDPFHIIGTIALLLIAGIDTTWSAIGASLWHLGKTPSDREQLVTTPDMIPIAMEEMLRAYAPVTMARLVKEDMDFHGCPMKKEDWVLLSFPAANRDSELFPNADDIVIDREINRHSAFGLGVHRCLGSHLARMELNVAVQTWLERYPDFELADPSAVTWSGGQVRGPRVLPLSVVGSSL